MLTEFYDDKTGPLYSVGQEVWTIDEQTGDKVFGKVTEVGEETIVVQWEDLKDDTEYERQNIELDGDRLYEKERRPTAPQKEDK